MHKGAYAGYPVVDVKVNLIDGSYHDVDSSELAFRLAAISCFKETFVKADPVLLEPCMSVEVTCPGRVCQRYCGEYLFPPRQDHGMEMKGNLKIVEAEAPLAEMFGYATTFRSLSSGRANASMHFEKYQEVPFEIAQKIMAENAERKAKQG